jgi:uncharacterized protein (DUF58 family)
MAGGIVLAVSEPPSHLRAMAAYELEVTVQNRTARLPVIDLHIDGSLASGGHLLDTMAENVVSLLIPGAEAVRRWAFIIRNRAPLRIGPFRATVQLPGSFVKAVATFDQQSVVPIFPTTYRLQLIVKELLAGKRLAVGRMTQLPSGIEVFVGAREYRPGDNPKLIHRVLSLRAPNYPLELYVREYEDPSEDDVSIILDTTRPDPAVEALHRYRFEKAISFAAALCRTLATQKYKVRFLCQRAPDQIFEHWLRPLDTDIFALESVLATLDLTGDRQTILQTLVKETRRRGRAVIFISLREHAEEVLQAKLPIVSVTPNLIPVFTREVVWR